MIAWSRRVALCILLAQLAGCSMFGGPKPVKPAWRSVAFAAAPDANANSAVAVDVVLVKDKAVLDTLAAMSAARYFAAKADLLRTYPDALTALAVEITPGQLIQVERKRYGAERAWAALAFANYAVPGEHRVRVPLDGAACLVQLNAQDFVVTDAATGGAR
jgi:type VI secretion system protein